MKTQFILTCISLGIPNIDGIFVRAFSTLDDAMTEAYNIINSFIDGFCGDGYINVFNKQKFDKFADDSFAELHSDELINEDRNNYVPFIPNIEIYHGQEHSDTYVFIYRHEGEAIEAIQITEELIPV